MKKRGKRMNVIFLFTAYIYTYCLWETNLFSQL